MAKRSDNDTKDVYIEYIPMDLENVEHFEYDEAWFAKGIDVGSYLAGIGTALRNMNSEIDKDDLVELLKCVIESNYGIN